MGDIAQELWLARRAEPDWICLAGEPSHVAALALARSLGRKLWGHPIVAVMHHPASTRRWDRQVVLGLDQMVCLSSAVRDQLIERHGVRPGSVVSAPWGPDLDFPGYFPSGAEGLVSVGKTNRDVRTLLRALDGLGIPARVHSREPARPPTAGVKIITPPAHRPDGQFDYAEVLAELQSAAIVAIPLSKTNFLSGLSELNDAMALSKPILMTRTPFIDVDIEEVGCGLWIDHGDVEGWRAAISLLRDDPELGSEMGRRGRSFAERSWNSRLFGEAVLSALRRAEEHLP
jgi:glycosyltransferase involved in cell wall biosynthesis